MMVIRQDSVPDVIANKLDHLLILTSGTEQYLITCTNKKYKFLLTTTLTISGVSLPQRGGMAKINIHLQKLGNWFFTQIYFLIFFNSIKIDFLKILISQYFVFFFSQHFYIFSNCTSV